MCTWVKVPPKGQKPELLMGLEVRVGVNQKTWVLEAQPGSPVRAVNALTS